MRSKRGIAGAIYLCKIRSKCILHVSPSHSTIALACRPVLVSVTRLLSVGLYGKPNGVEQSHRARLAWPASGPRRGGGPRWSGGPRRTSPPWVDRYSINALVRESCTTTVLQWRGCVCQMSFPSDDSPPGDDNYILFVTVPNGVRAPVISAWPPWPREGVGYIAYTHGPGGELGHLPAAPARA